MAETKGASLPKSNKLEKQSVNLLHLMQKHLLTAMICMKSHKVNRF